MKVGILRETRHWKDRRTPVTPETALLIRENFPEINLVVQTSPIRIYRDDDYQNIGIPVVDDVSDCDLLIGIKEVNSESLFEGKTYLIFSHTGKKQIYNQSFFREMIQKKITLIDYEYLTDNDGLRLVAFGFWAGVAGGYYALQGIARKWLHQNLPGPDQCTDLMHLYRHIQSLPLPALKIIITGGGRVASGAIEVMKEAGIHEVSPTDFLNHAYPFPVYTQLNPEDYVVRKSGSFSTNDFFMHPQDYRSDFKKYLPQTDVFIACHYWNCHSPIFFKPSQVRSNQFQLSVIADISCDLNGPIPTTIRSTTHRHPWYDIEKKTLREVLPFSAPDNLSVMAVDNLPTAMPIDASRSFARDLYHHVFPALFSHHDPDRLLKKASILKNGQLTPPFRFLKDY